MTEYEIKPKNRLTLGLQELWQYRELFYFFTWRDIKVKYKQTTLGFLWAILQPFMLMIIFSFFFGYKMNVPSDGLPYPVFSFSGLLLWNIFSSGMSNAGNSMIANSNIIKKIYFPRLIIPISAVLSSLFDFFMAFIVFAGMLVYYRTDVSWGLFIVMLPLSILLTSLATFGLGTWLAALNIKYRDFRYILPFIIQSMMFITPVIYPISIVGNSTLKYLLALNPIYGAIELFRYPISHHQPDPQLIAISVCSAFVILLIGLFYFRRTESYFADLA